MIGRIVLMLTFVALLVSLLVAFGLPRAGVCSRPDADARGATRRSHAPAHGARAARWVPTAGHAHAGAS